MDLLYYNELDYTKVKKQFKKVEKALANNDFKSADIKKMIPTDYYRAKLDKTNRLLFKFAKYDGKKYILLLEVILNHDYEKSKFLRGAEIREDKFEVIEKPEVVKAESIKNLIYLNKRRRHFYMLDKIISFDEAQDEIYALPTPLTIIGSAGSGKTILTLEKLKKLNGTVAYISLSEFLVENAQNIYYSNNYTNDKQEIDFLSFNEYVKSIKIPKGSELPYKTFENWFNKHKQHSNIADPYRLYEEFKGVLTGSVVDSAYLSENDYLDLGVKQSIFNRKQRENIYSIFKKYIKFLEDTSWYDINMLSYKYLDLVREKYDFIVIDEVQDITNIQLKLILSSLKIRSNFILSGDSNQIVHPNFFSWSKIKSLFFKDNFDFSLIRILKTNYRNSQEVTKLSNLLLKIKNSRFGSIDKESTYLIDSVSEKSGEVTLISDNKKQQRNLNSKTQNSTKYAVLVMTNDDKKKARKHFKTPLIFSIQEAKGLEYENIILLNFITNNETKFDNIVSGITKADLEENLKYSRARDKTDKDLEVYKFFINSLYVAITRSVKNLYILEEKKNHRIFELLELKETTQKINIKEEKSDEEDWLQEAKKLELQGKHEQARQIRDKIAGVKYITPEEYENIKKIALDKNKTEQEAKRERKDLFKYAVARKEYEDLQELADLNFMRAVIYMKQIRQVRKEYEKSCRLNRMNEVKQVVKKYGIDFKIDNDNSFTGLQYAVKYANLQLVNFFLKNDASILNVNKEQRTSIQTAIYTTYKYEILKDKNIKSNFDYLKQVYPKLQQKNITCIIDDKLIKINNQSMAFFLLNFMKATQSKIVAKKIDELLKQDDEIVRFLTREQIKLKKKVFETNKAEAGLKMDDFLEFIEKIPETILPEYRRKRSYVNSVLANNEIERDFIYNKKLFKRTRRGVYILNPDIQFENIKIL